MGRSYGPESGDPNIWCVFLLLVQPSIEYSRKKRKTTLDSIPESSLDIIQPSAERNGQFQQVTKGMFLCWCSVCRLGPHWDTGTTWARLQTERWSSRPAVGNCSTKQHLCLDSHQFPAFLARTDPETAHIKPPSFRTPSAKQKTNPPPRVFAVHILKEAAKCGEAAKLLVDLNQPNPSKPWYP